VYVELVKQYCFISLIFQPFNRIDTCLSGATDLFHSCPSSIRGRVLRTYFRVNVEALTL